MSTKVPPISTPGLVLMPLLVAGATTASATGKVQLQMPFACKLLSVTAKARSSTGTDPTLAADVLVGGESVLADPIAVTAAAFAAGDIEAPDIPDEAVLSIDVTIGGTSSPTFNDVSFLLTLVRV